jgi:hypothetical protein
VVGPAGMVWSMALHMTPLQGRSSPAAQPPRRAQTSGIGL